MILVVGASGVLGREAARKLLAAGHRVRATARDPGHLADLEHAGAEVRPADLIDPASLGAACQGVDAVFVAAHSLLGTGRCTSDAIDGAGHRALIDAARSAGVKRFVYTSARGAAADHPVDFFRTKAAVERYLEASGVDFTILRPSAFMEWHVHNLLGKRIVDAGTTTLFGRGNNPTNFVAARDVAEHAVLALADTGTIGRTLEIGGPDNVTKLGVVAIYERLLGRPAKVRHVPVAAMRVMAPLLRPVKPVLSRLMTLAVWSDTTDQTFDVGNTAPERQKRLIRVEDFVRARIAS